MQNNYELNLLFSGDNTSEEIDGQAKETEKLLEQIGAQIVFTHSLGRRKLAYEIKHRATGEYRLWYFQADSEKIGQLKDKLNLSTPGLRFLLLAFADSPFAKIIDKMKELAAGRVKKMTPEREARRTEGAADGEKEDAEQDKKAKKKLSIEELDKKLDEILTDDKL